MELHQLKVFVAVAEEGHLTRAAERLFSSQPAVSAQIKSLESQLGLPLFDRTPKGMKLTEAGAKLLVQAKLTLSTADNMLIQAKALQGNVMGEVIVGTNSDIDFLRMTGINESLNTHHPDVTLSLTQSMSADILVDVKKGSLDTGFYFGPCGDDAIHQEHLADVPTAVVAPLSWRERIEGKNIEELAALPWIYTKPTCPFYLLKENVFQQCETQTNKVLFVDSEDHIRAFIKSEAGISLLRQDDADKAEAEGWGCRWDGDTPSCPLSVAVLKSRIEEPIIQAWLQALKNTWHEEPTPKLRVV